MGIFRKTKKEKNYFIMDKTSVKDERLSWKAKGLHAYMLSLPDDWVFYNEELVKHAKDGIDSVKSGIAELKKYGYLQRVAVKNEKGQFDHWETLVYEVPFIPEVENSNPEVENPQVENPLVENPQLLNNNSLLINKNTNVEIINYLNEKTNSNFKTNTKATNEMINARLKEKHSLEDFKLVIDYFVQEWTGKTFSSGQKADKYLTPSVLFNTKFNERVNEASKNYKPQQPTKKYKPYSIGDED